MVCMNGVVVQECRLSYFLLFLFGITQFWECTCQQWSSLAAICLLASLLICNTLQSVVGPNAHHQFVKLQQQQAFFFRAGETHFSNNYVSPQWKSLVQGQ
uniref:Uncharacterized protein n=1 Tax=Eutreptiella gymnastica TaxID=73025 RepID=A0A6U8D927_9EUGL|mmetsp:Transcript_2864/g.5069  ORF Transcript_2864/g.5069 Transcript_2864/m.5069 type:complete len:100 (+) Transcript_2864:306-605(+)